MTRKSLLAVAVCLLSVLAVGFAQSLDLKVTFQHPVSVGSVTLPAGDYTIRELKASSSTPVLVFRSADGTSVSALASIVSEPNRETTDQVILRQVGDSYQLERIWLAGQNIGYEFMH